MPKMASQGCLWVCQMLTLAEFSRKEVRWGEKTEREEKEVKGSLERREKTEAKQRERLKDCSSTWWTFRDMGGTSLSFSGDG